MFNQYYKIGKRLIFDGPLPVESLFIYCAAFFYCKPLHIAGTLYRHAHRRRLFYYKRIMHTYIFLYKCLIYTLFGFYCFLKYNSVVF